jgi:hypothetical protein
VVVAHLRVLFSVFFCCSFATKFVRDIATTESMARREKRESYFRNPLPPNLNVGTDRVTVRA